MALGAIKSSSTEITIVGSFLWFLGESVFVNG